MEITLNPASSTLNTPRKNHSSQGLTKTPRSNKKISTEILAFGDALKGVVPSSSSKNLITKVNDSVSIPLEP